MADVLIMPRQGNTVESCIIVEWKVKEGDTVSVDTPTLEVETDKATFEIPSGFDGTVLKILYEAGDDVPVLKPIMVIGKEGEDWQSLVADDVSSDNSTSTNETQLQDVESTMSPQMLVSTDSNSDSTQNVSVQRQNGEHVAISPRAKNLANKEVVEYSTLAGSGPEGRIIERDVQQALQNRPPLTASAKDALRLGGTVPSTGSGFAGRITLDDIQSVRFSSSETASQNLADEIAETPIKGIRKVIAERMMTSLGTTAQFTLNASAHAIVMQNIRKRLKEQGEFLGLTGVTVNDLVLFLVSRLLPRFPEMNALKVNNTVKTYKHVHLGVAVDTPRGLMVPVIRFADCLSLRAISQTAKSLAHACIEGTISPDQLTGSTFTVTNLGNTGIESFTPVINTPEVAILGVCSLQPKPFLNVNGEYDIVPHLPFSLTIDHAVVDGAPAARFIKALCTAMTNLDLWLAV